MGVGHFLVSLVVVSLNFNAQWVNLQKLIEISVYRLEP